MLFAKKTLGFLKDWVIPLSGIVTIGLITSYVEKIDSLIKQTSLYEKISSMDHLAGWAVISGLFLTALSIVLGIRLIVNGKKLNKKHSDIVEDISYKVSLIERDLCHGYSLYADIKKRCKNSRPYKEDLISGNYDPEIREILQEQLNYLPKEYYSAKDETISEIFDSPLYENDRRMLIDVYTEKLPEIENILLEAKNKLDDKLLGLVKNYVDIIKKFETIQDISSFEDGVAYHLETDNEERVDIFKKIEKKIKRFV